MFFNKKLIKIINGIITTILFITILFYSSCTLSKDVDSKSIAKLFLSSDTSHILPQYDSPYTIGTQNRDGTYSIFIFSAPIQFKSGLKYTIIDNGIVESKNSDYAYENASNEIKTYFPAKLEDCFLVSRLSDFIRFRPKDTNGFSSAKKIIFRNLYDDEVEAVSYSRKDMDLIFYATNAGIRCEIIQKTNLPDNSIFFLVEVSEALMENNKNGYIRFYKDKLNIALIYQPLLKTANGELSINTEMILNQSNQYYELQIKLKESDISEQSYPLRYDPSFELYRNKTPDTSIYSDYDLNSYLRHYAVVGTHPNLGEGWAYLRFRINRFFTIRSDTLISATYHSKVLLPGSDETKLTMCSVDKDWSSAQMIWSTKVEPLKQIACPMTEELGVFDIADFTKRAIEDMDNIEEANGCVLRVEGGDDFVVLATSDNSLYIPYIHLNLSKKPLAFVPRDNINPQ